MVLFNSVLIYVAENGVLFLLIAILNNDFGMDTFGAPCGDWGVEENREKLIAS